MAQVFERHHVQVIKLGLIIAVVLLTGAIIWWKLTVSAYVDVQEPMEQPIPFSHKHHVSDDGIDCRYCHQSVEVSAYAGIPPLHTCMTCHSQLYTHQPVLAPLLTSLATDEALRWRKVNSLPAFVYFNHAIHVHKGVGCETCHGRVDQMPLTWRAHTLNMQWCLGCHRNLERYIRPRSAVFEMGWQPPKDRLALGRRLVKEYGIRKKGLADCSTCHR
jgi:hypothetical protein